MSRWLAVALALAFARAAAAQESAAFLTLGAGARPAAMGGAYAAVGDDSSAAAYNPAGLAGVAKREIQMTHREAIARTRFEHLGIALPRARGVFAASISYLGHDSLTGRDEAGAETGRYNALDLSAGLSYAAKLPGSKGFSLGAGAKYIKSSIAEVSAQTYAFDIGVRYERPYEEGKGSPMAGLAVRNFGPGMRFIEERTPLPRVMTAGLGYRFPFGLLVDFDYSRRPYAVLVDELAAGAEIALLPAFLLRAGFGSAAARADGGGIASVFRGVTAGFGVRLKAWSVDFSITPMGELGNSQAITLAARY